MSARTARDEMASSSPSVPQTTNGQWDLIAELRAASLADSDRVLRE